MSKSGPADTPGGAEHIWNIYGGCQGGKVGVFEVALLDGKELIVENKAGRVVIDRVGEGTAIGAADVAPTPPKAWSSDKVKRAVATVAF